MHKIIYLVVKSDNEKDAWSELEHLRYLICDEKKWYDYGTFFNEDSPMSGKNRWGNITPIAIINSNDGKVLLDSAFAVIERQFNDSLIEVKKAIDEYTPKELYDGEITDVKSKIIEGLKDKSPRDNFALMMFRYHLRQMHDTEHYGWLYVLEREKEESWAEGFENKKEFITHFNDRDKNKYWIAPLDVHF